MLKPRAIYPDPFRQGKNILVMCDCFKPDGTPIDGNTRVKAADMMEKAKKEHPWFGIEQEYTLFEPDGVTPFGWPKGGQPDRPQVRTQAIDRCMDQHGDVEREKDIRRLQP